MVTANFSNEYRAYTPPGNDDELQNELLQGVSRTFALTIPQLPPALRNPVSNAYLLCRIVDTIEDETSLDYEQKKRFARQFVSVVEGNSPADQFARQLLPMLSDTTIAQEQQLIRLTPEVIDITHRFNQAQQSALKECVSTMAEGMIEFQQPHTGIGLNDMPHMDRYCYFVAGVVGEMLTKLFCDYSSEINRHREKMLALSVSFGQGLQMTNILKDIWDDNKRNACWLPKTVFAGYGYNLDNLSTQGNNRHFQLALEKLIGVSQGHLKNALAYTLLIPTNEPGIRKFCLWALGMALLTLRKINTHKGYTSGREVKITRRSVKATVLVSNLFVSSDSILKYLFNLLSAGLPGQPQENEL